MNATRFPRSLAECRAMLAQRERETGYRTVELASRATLRPHFGQGGGCCLVSHGRQIVTWQDDGTMVIDTMGGKTYAGLRLARINACLPEPYRVAKQDKGGRTPCELWRGAERVKCVPRVFTFREAA